MGNRAEISQTFNSWTFSYTTLLYVSHISTNKYILLHRATVLNETHII
jgi:hypothetical protein